MEGMFMAEFGDLQDVLPSTSFLLVFMTCISSPSWRCPSQLQNIASNLISGPFRVATETHKPF
jgi:hypothetical protein